MRSSSFNSSQGNLNSSGQEEAECAWATKLPVSSSLLDLGDQSYLIELFPMAAYAVRAPDGVIAWFNSRAAELWGRMPKIGATDERFCGAHTLYHADGTYMAHCDTPVALALKTGDSVHEEEVVIEKPDGSRVTVSVHINPIRDNDGGIVGVVNFFHDISERKQAERTTGLLAAIVGSSDDAIISKNLDGTITTWNKGAERIFGYTAEEAIGHCITMIIPPARLDEEVAILERLKRGERVDHFETVRLRKDGAQLDVSLTISPLKDTHGRVVGASKVARDITERKRAQEELQLSEERLRIFANGLENEVRVRTHQLEQRNAEVLQQSGQLRELSSRLLQTQDHERRRIARELHDSAGQVVTALGLELATITQHAEKPRVQKAAEESLEMVRQLSKEIRTVSYLLHPPLLDEIGLSGAIRWFIEGLAERSGLKIELLIPENFGRLPDDTEVAVFRIVQECLTNIHRHSGSKTATIRLSRNFESVFLEIQDEGIGISEEKLAAIRTQRSGVGISGMRERVRQLTGVMSIQANANGTTISITFPVLTTATSTSDLDISGQQAKAAQSSI
jgi:PAS domain S-box-containing protein